jgi:hypothetical protein
MMGHNPPYYPEFAIRYGFEKLFDGLAYRFDLSFIDYKLENAPEVLKKIAERALRHHGQSVIHSPKMENWDNEVVKLHAVYNKSLTVLPEFSPIELAEFQASASGLRSVMDPELVFIAEVDGKTAGFVLGIPNFTEALRYANGLQYPWDYIRLFWRRRRSRASVSRSWRSIRTSGGTGWRC